jgi:hypothetical protein
MPAGVWALTWLWQTRPRREAKGEGGGRWAAVGRTAGWIAAGTAVPFLVTWAWIRYSDAVKALNVAGSHLTSTNLRSYNFGSADTRFAAHIWRGHWNIINDNLASVIVLGVLAMLVLTRPGRWRRWGAWCVGCFAAVQLLFPVLYSFHDYYYMANAVLLMIAMGLVLCDLLESPLPRWTAWGIILFIYGAQIGLYLRGYYPAQRQGLHGGSEITDALRDFTAPDDVLVIIGEDWSSKVPYYAQRRALMVPSFLMSDRPAIEQAFHRIQGEPVAALVLRDSARGDRDLRELATREFGVSAAPLFTWKDFEVYVHPRLREKAVGVLCMRFYDGLKLTADAAEIQQHWFRREVRVDQLVPAVAAVFAEMSPPPTRVYTTYGLGLTPDGLFSSHPDSRIWFKAAAGRREINAKFQIYPGAWEGAPPGEATDGVEFSVYEVRSDGTRRVLFQRLLNPRDVPEDRGLQALNVTADLAAGSEVMFETGPGPHANYTRDWAVWGKITIR